MASNPLFPTSTDPSRPATQDSGPARPDVSIDADGGSNTPQPPQTRHVPAAQASLQAAPLTAADYRQPAVQADSSGTTPVPAPRPSPARAQDGGEANPAVDLIRQKLARIFAEEPDARQEQQEAVQAGPQASVHQRFMRQLTESGKSLAEIQTAWHQYYASLPDDQKRQVWQEFYAANAPANQPGRMLEPQAGMQAHPDTRQQPSGQSAGDNRVHGWQPAAPASARPRVPANIYPTPTALAVPASYKPAPGQAAGQAGPADLAGWAGLTSPAQPATDAKAGGDDSQAGPTAIISRYDDRPPSSIQQQLRDTVSRRAKLKPRHHIQSLLFGLGCGGLALLVVLFSFFNEVVIAPFIQPSRQVSATPIIIGADGVAPTDQAQVIIPKINVQIPLDFSVKTIKEEDIQNGLEGGVVHYPTTAMPGQDGNAAFFGHSSNNIFNPGKYKFAFVLLHELVPGDTFYLTNNGVAYAYQVIDKKVVDPSDVGILDPIPGRKATATLVTCDPPGTTLHRLAVIGQQVSPDPNANVPSTPQTSAPSTAGKTQTLPGDGPSLWHRLTSWITG